MSRAGNEDLVDCRDHALAMPDVASGGMPMIADADMDASWPRQPLWRSGGSTVA
jgi:hypothetical protein